MDFRVGGRDVMRMTADGLGGEGIYTKNLLRNGDFRVVEHGTLFTATSTPANDDDTYLLDGWVNLSDGDDVVDVSQQTATAPTGGSTCAPS